MDCCLGNQRPVMQDVFKNTRQLEDYTIPVLEMMVILKYAVMISPNRDEDDQEQDKIDLNRMIKNNPKLSLPEVYNIARTDFDLGKLLEYIMKVLAKVHK